jgi:hypothetical protein
LGVLVAVPAAAVAKIFVTRAVQYYCTTALYLQAPPDTMAAQPLRRHTGISDRRPAEQDHHETPSPKEG